MAGHQVTFELVSMARHSLGWTARFRIRHLEDHLPFAPEFDAEARAGETIFAYHGATVWASDEETTAELVFSPLPKPGVRVDVVVHGIRTDSRLTEGVLEEVGGRRSEVVGPWRSTMQMPETNGGDVEGHS